MRRLLVSLAALTLTACASARPLCDCCSALEKSEIQPDRSGAGARGPWTAANERRTT